VPARLAATRVGHVVARADQALFIYRHHKGTVALSVAYSWAAQAASVFAIYFLATGLGSEARLHHFFINMPVVWIFWSLIPGPGGFGVAEGLAQRLFTASVLGVRTAAEAATLALTMILALRVVQLAVSLPGAALYLSRRTNVSPRRMRETMAAADPEGAEAPPFGDTATSSRSGRRRRRGCDGNRSEGCCLTWRTRGRRRSSPTPTPPTSGGSP
jgi:hypothetical protein